MTTDLRQLCYSSDSSSSLDPSEIIEQFVDSDLSQISQPASIHDLDATVSRVLDYHSSGSESNEEYSHDTMHQNMTSRREHVPQTDAAYRLIYVRKTGSSASSAPMKDATNVESHNESSPLLDNTDGKMKETQPEHDHKPTSVRGGASFINTSVAMKGRGPSSKVAYTDSKILPTNSEMPLSSRENHCAVKNLALRRLQSDQSSKSSPTGSLQGTPSASSSQLYYDSDECIPKPLAEELEEVTAQEELETQPLIDSNKGRPPFTESSDSSCSEFNSSEEGSEEGSFESGEQRSSEEIDFELQEGDSLLRELCGEDKMEAQHPLLAVLTTASKQKHNGHPSSDSSKCVHNHKKLEPKATHIVGEGGFHLPVSNNYTKRGEVVTSVQSRKERSPPQTKGSRSEQKDCDWFPKGLPSRIQGQVSHQKCHTAQSSNSDVLAAAEGSPSSPQPLQLSNAANHTPPSAELCPVNETVMKNSCIQEESKVTICKNGGVLPKHKDTALIQDTSTHGNPSETNRRSSPRPVKVKGKMIQKGRPMNKGSVSKMQVQDSIADQKQHQRPRFQHRNPRDDPSHGQHLKTPLVSDRKGTNAGESGAQVTERSVETRSLSDQAKGYVTEEAQKPEKTSFEFQVEDLIHTDSEESIISSISEASYPVTDALANKSTPAQVTVQSLQARNTLNNNLTHTGNEGTGIITPVSEVSSLALQTAAISISTNRSSPPCHTLALEPKPSTAAASKQPLKGILKKTSRRTSNASADTDNRTDTSSNNSEEVAGDRTPTGSTKQQSTPSTAGSLQPSSKGQYLSSSSVPEQTTNSRISVRDSTSSSTSCSDDGRDLNRTLTEEHRPSSNTINSAAPKDSQKKDVLISDQQAQTDSEAALVTSYDENGVQGLGNERDLEQLHMQYSSSFRNQQSSFPVTSNHLLNQKRSSTSHNPQPTLQSTTPLLSLDILTHTDSEATILSSNDVTPEEATDCLSMMLTYTSTQDKTQSQGSYNLVDKVRALELRQLRIENAFAVEREALWDIILQQNELMVSLCKKRGQDRAQFTSMKRHLRLLERKMEDLEAGVVRIGRTAINQQRNGAPGSLTEADLPGSEPWHRMGSLVSKKKLDKLTKFFGDTPPILQQFLKRLGYEEHIKKFENAGIGLPELPHTTAEQLKQLGIPLGHRARILQEAQKLTLKK